MSNSTQIHTQSGFTLIEVVIALAILGTGMIMLLESHYASLMLFSEAQDATLIELLSKQGTALVEVEVLTGEENGSGDFGDAYPDYTYEFTTHIIDEFELPGLLEVEFSLHTPTDEEAHTFTFRVYDGAIEYGN